MTIESSSLYLAIAELFLRLDGALSDVLTISLWILVHS